ncbi:Response regulator receiver domain protein (CheY) [Richelia intracellularis HM01]|uniref:DUF3685 domain-containing protein n=1 Tax=Richelia intracellularis TaxID=1164990 RepID=UPI0002B4E41A|nr:DUF3685 domain-containing protein [Richelia intracellularis]CCH65278.1 Response regulator receiver domain protein (CheY) [Richelia intracellularis HM01]
MNFPPKEVPTCNHPIKLLLIEQDPIFRLGLQTALAEYIQVHIIATVESDTATLQILTELSQTDPTQVNLVVMELGNGRSRSSQYLGLLLCKQLKAQYPNLPLFLFSAIKDVGWLLAAKKSGVDGYCPKSTPIPDLVIAMGKVIAGDNYWMEEIDISEEPEVTNDIKLPLIARLKRNLRMSSMSYINFALVGIKEKLQLPGLPILERVILVGRQRELIVAGKLVQFLLTSFQENKQQHISTMDASFSTIGETIPFRSSQKSLSAPALLSPKAIQSELFTSVVNKLQFSLQNLTDIPLEIDILRDDKKQELLYLILHRLVDSLDDLRDSSLNIHQLSEVVIDSLMDLWETVTKDFFGKFTKVNRNGRDIEIVDWIMRDRETVQKEIIGKIPLVKDLFVYLIFQEELTVDNSLYPAYSSEAKERGSMLIENLLIQVGNSIIQPVLNRLADVKYIKDKYYDRRLDSTRVMEKFRNELSWKYRVRNYIQEPQEIFESRFQIFVFTHRGIARTSVYAHRNHELSQLTGIPLSFTLVLEFRDAIAPLLQSLVSFLGKGIIFILTKVMGRAIGLIGKGILQALSSNSMSDKTSSRK